MTPLQLQYRSMVATFVLASRSVGVTASRREGSDEPQGRMAVTPTRTRQNGSVIDESASEWTVAPSTAWIALMS
jgi:hypothetical protein